jgi:hypothetical protein
MMPGWYVLRFGFAAFGVFILYSRWGKDSLRLYVPRDLLRTWHLGADLNARWEFALFMVIGAAIAVLFTHPTTPQQAISAGLGWTGLLAAPEANRKHPKSGAER